MSRRASRSGCPVCGQPTRPDHNPFCGQGCRDRDLLAWLGEGYRLPGPAADPAKLQSGLDSEDSAD